VIATRGESLLALPVVYSEAETDVIGREYALLPESALLPGTFNTLRMLFKFAGVEALRAATLEAAAAKGRHRHHAYVLRIRPDLELLGRLNVVSPVLLNDAAAAAAAWSRGTAVLVPWVCPASQLLFDQLQIMRPQAAASLARLALSPGDACCPGGRVNGRGGTPNARHREDGAAAACAAACGSRPSQC